MTAAISFDTACDLCPYLGVTLLATSALTGVSVHTTTASNQVYTTSTTNSEVTLHGSSAPNLGVTFHMTSAPDSGVAVHTTTAIDLEVVTAIFPIFFLLSYVFFFLFSF